MDQNVKSTTTTQALLDVPIEDNKLNMEKTHSKNNLVSCTSFCSKVIPFFFNYRDKILNNS
jgi:hypothetical protein